MTKRCSGGISKVWHLFTDDHPPFEYCCNNHDLLYRDGGTPDDRRFADQLLRDCVAENGYPKLAAVMYYAVRLFGWIYWER